MKAICREWKFGLTLGKEYVVIPYPERLQRLSKGHVRLANDFGNTYDYAKSRFEVREQNPPPPQKQKVK